VRVPVRHKLGTLTAASDGRNLANRPKTSESNANLDKHKRRILSDAVLASRPVQTRSGTSPARLAAVLAGVLVGAALPTAGGADPTSTPADRARDLRALNATLEQRSAAALLGLYALDTRLGAARAELVTLRRRAAQLAQQRADVRLELRLARRAFDVSRRQLDERLHVLYVQGQTDPMAVLLGAESLDDALDRIEELNRTAALNESVITQALSARKALRALARSLAVKTARVERLERATAGSAAALERKVGERRAYIASLGSRQRLNARTIASLETAAAAAQAKTAALAAAPARTASPANVDAPAAPLASGQTLTVVATGYSLPGTTATGLRVSWGVVAVDPALIPLGTRMTVPGYGEGVAADIGHAVRGASIDLWFPTRQEALAWGRRVVTITLH
jgi:peptidoglycan DL-endopeptidase CwlO